jgi:hypothetical protein
MNGQSGLNVFFLVLAAFVAVILIVYLINNT